MPNLTPATHCPHLRLTHGGLPSHSLQQLLCAAVSWIKENSDQCQLPSPPWAVPPLPELRSDPSSAQASPFPESTSGTS